MTYGKAFFWLVFASWFSTSSLSAQTYNQSSINVSMNQLTVSYHRNFSETPVWAGCYFGFGNQDINADFDDILTGIQLGRRMLRFKKSNISLVLNTGIYYPENDYYTATTLCYGLNLTYEKCFGKSGKHSLLMDAGYQYGRKSYKQHYENDLISVSTTGLFEVSPLVFSIGYGYNF